MTIPPADDKAEAARQLEAFFLRRLFAEARPAGGDQLLGGGFAGETFREMLDEQLADRMAAAGGVGLAAVVGAQFGADPAAFAARPASAPVADVTAIDGVASIRTREAAPPPRTSGGDPASAPVIAGGASMFALPVAARMSSRYGMRRDPIDGGLSLHAGLDLAARAGTPVAAAAAGTVVRAGPAGTYGNLVAIRHPSGLETRYAHLSVVGVAVGDVVAAGATIGAVGSTGRSTGPHLHFEVRRGGKPVDPEAFVSGATGLNSTPPRSNP